VLAEPRPGLHLVAVAVTESIDAVAASRAAMCGGGSLLLRATRRDCEKPVFEPADFLSCSGWTPPLRIVTMRSVQDTSGDCSAAGGAERAGGFQSTGIQLAGGARALSFRALLRPTNALLNDAEQNRIPRRVTQLLSS